MVYYICHCISLYVCLGEMFILGSRLAIFWKKLYFWLSACSVLIVVPLLYVRPSSPLEFWNRRCKVILSIPDH